MLFPALSFLLSLSLFLFFLFFSRFILACHLCHSFSCSCFLALTVYIPSPCPSPLSPSCSFSIKAKVIRKLLCVMRAALKWNIITQLIVSWTFQIFVLLFFEKALSPLWAPLLAHTMDCFNFAQLLFYSLQTSLIKEMDRCLAVFSLVGYNSSQYVSGFCIGVYSEWEWIWVTCFIRHGWALLQMSRLVETPLLKTFE